MGVLPDAPRGCIRSPSNSDKAYFFAGDRYWRYDLGDDYGELRYPMPLSLWHLPGAFASGIDATLDGVGQYAGKSYFFKADQYVRYNWATDTIDVGPRSIGAWGLSGAFAAGVDLAFNGQAPYAGKAYFFKADRYVRYDWASDAVDLDNQPISAWNLGPGFADGLTACCNIAPFVGPPKSYFFKGGSYVRYNWSSDHADAGYPLPTSAAWPTGLAVWAEHQRAPLLVCPDARLEGGANRVIAYPGGTPSGQAGWQFGIKFSNPSGLAQALEQATIPSFYGDDDAGSGLVPPGSITRLAINAHGLPGQLDTGSAPFEADRLSAFTIGVPPLRTNLERIGHMLEPGAPIVLLGCNAARGDSGDDLLEPLSLIWSGHEVSAFTTIGYSESGKQKRPEEPCDNPGMRVTSETAFFSDNPVIEQQMEDQHFSPIWNDLVALPWGHEGLGPHRKTALNGQIVYFDVDD